MRLAGACLTALWLGALGVGCGRAHSEDRAVRANSEPGRDESPATRPDASPGEDDDAGAPSLPADDGTSCNGPDCGECPPPPRVPGQIGQGVWVRNPSTAGCCHVASISAAPSTWPLFGSEDACQNDCRCAISEDGQVEYRASIECICSVEDCPSTIEEAEQRLCNEARFPPEPAVQRLVGCGMVMVIDRNGYSGDSWVFEQPLESTGTAAAAPRLVGSGRSSDASSEACIPELWGAGRDFFECEEEIVSCQLCGDSPGTDFPPCE